MRQYFGLEKIKDEEINILEDFYLNLLNNIENKSINIEEFGYVIIKEAKLSFCEISQIYKIGNKTKDIYAVVQKLNENYEPYGGKYHIFLNQIDFQTLIDIKVFLSKQK